jgi:hypothetical protein
MSMEKQWVKVSHPLSPQDDIPAERKVVLAWIEGSVLPYCAYIRYAAGDQNCPYFVVYHGNSARGSAVIAWCDCLPDNGPDLELAEMYSRDQKTGRGFPARQGNGNCELTDSTAKLNDCES